MLIKYASRSFIRGGGDLADPGNRWGEETVAGMTDAMLSVMRGPDRDVRAGNVPRLTVADDGEVSAEYDRSDGALYNAAPAGPDARAVDTPANAKL